VRNPVVEGASIFVKLSVMTPLPVILKKVINDLSLGA